MTALRARAAALGRAGALIATAAILIATVDVAPCAEGQSASYSADTTCGPPGVVALQYSHAESSGCDGCWAFLEAPGANAVGLPEQGEVDYGRERSLSSGDFALVGAAPVAGATPPRSVRRTCNFTPAGADVLEVACTGDDPAAACAGTLTAVPAGGAGP